MRVTFAELKLLRAQLAHANELHEAELSAVRGELDATLEANTGLRTELAELNGKMRPLHWGWVDKQSGEIDVVTVIDMAGVPGWVPVCVIVPE